MACFFHKCLIFSRNMGTTRYGGDQVWSFDI